MIQKLEILDENLNKLDEINNMSFSFENFKEINSQIEKILVDLKSNEETLKINKSSQEYINIFNNILNKIDMLETKILPKANLLSSFSKSKS
jgi:hypothetical protein|tara:strand:- start:107 stop:382 length:276 start_codon:yes stop_codon:yes gene_type:complete